MIDVVNMRMTPCRFVEGVLVLPRVLSVRYQRNSYTCNYYHLSILTYSPDSSTSVFKRREECPFRLGRTYFLQEEGVAPVISANILRISRVHCLISLSRDGRGFRLTDGSGRQWVIVIQYLHSDSHSHLSEPYLGEWHLTREE
jgi:hypothetical protein